MKQIILLIVILIQQISAAFGQYGHWEELHPKHNPGYRGAHSMAQIDEKKILLFGGGDASANPLNDTWIFDLETNDWRLTIPRFTDNAIKENLKFVEVVEQIAQDKNVTKAQVALAWVLSQNDEIITIPGTRKVHHLEENLGAFMVELTKADLAVIQQSIPSVTIGNRY